MMYKEEHHDQKGQQKKTTVGRSINTHEMIKLYIKHKIVWKCLVTALIRYLKGEPAFCRNKAYAYVKCIVKAKVFL